MGFSTLLLAANIIQLAFFSESFHQYVRFAIAAAAATSTSNTGGGTDFPGPSVDEIAAEIEWLAFAQDLFLPVFFWVTDAFLVLFTFSSKLLVLMPCLVIPSVGYLVWEATGFDPSLLHLLRFIR